MMIWLENLPLFLLAIITGLLSTGWLIRLLPELATDVLPLINEIQLDGYTILLSIIIVVAINSIFSYLALIHINKQQLNSHLNHSGKGSQAQVGTAVSRSLMVIQIAIASILLTATVMLSIQSYQAVYRDLGYDYTDSYQIQLFLTENEALNSFMLENQSSHEEQRAFQNDVTEVIETSILGSNVVIPSYGPLSGSISVMSVADSDRPEPIMFAFRLLSADYFDSFDITFLSFSNNIIRVETKYKIDKNKKIKFGLD